MEVLEKLWEHIHRAEGAWNTIPNHHLLFTYQSRKGNSMVRKRMKYLKEGIVARHTYLTIQMWPIPHMPKTNSQLHDDIFMDSLAVDHGDEDIAL